MNTLAEGIAIAYDLEINNYLMTRYIERLSYEIGQLGLKAYCKRAPIKKDSDVSVIATAITIAIIGAILGAIIGIFAAVRDADAWWEYLFNPIGSAMKIGLIVGLCGGVIGIVVGLIRKNADNKRIEADYQNECAEHERRLKQEQARIQRELKQKRVLEKQLDNMKSRRSTSMHLLSRLYNSLNIDDKYCNILPIGFMYEFVRLGISDHLDGANGLYYLVRQELHWNQMEYTLNEISNKLDTIIDHNHALYGELKRMNLKCESLLSETQQIVSLAVKNHKQLSSIAEASSVIAYNTERIKAENSYQSFLMTLHLV